MLRNTPSAERLVHDVSLFSRFLHLLLGNSQHINSFSVTLRIRSNVSESACFCENRVPHRQYTFPGVEQRMQFEQCILSHQSNGSNPSVFPRDQIFDLASLLRTYKHSYSCSAIPKQVCPFQDRTESLAQHRRSTSSDFLLDLIPIMAHRDRVSIRQGRLRSPQAFIERA